MMRKGEKKETFRTSKPGTEIVTEFPVPAWRGVGSSLSPFTFLLR